MIGSSANIIVQGIAEKHKLLEGKEKVKSAFLASDTWLKVRGKGEGWGMTTMKVRASMEELAAFFLDFKSRALEVDGRSKEIVWGNEKAAGAFETVVRRVEKIESKRGGIHHDREFVSKVRVFKVNTGTIIITIEITTAIIIIVKA